ncbi:MAG: 4-(cytidine 5'-diphospho)-2-C-methyl-D-erythritol kinase [Chloroflexota bacterium]|nr:MAG: 4-(cytidine 5'-diphospho)-2-C-methyl-D-erythritol kinase [Chloroflexota bacterium]
MFVIRAPAKVNLALEVLNKRPDGYHEIVSVVQTIELCDELIFEPSDDLEVISENLSVPGEENLVLRAAEALQRATLSRKGARIRLVKRIPAGTGLGGGSSDAAATLWTLNHLWGCHLPEAELARLAATLGSDVPFFLIGATALVEGRGDRVSPLPQIPPSWLVLVALPADLPNKTAALYRALTAADFSDGRRTRLLVERISGGHAPSEALFVNTFERVADELFPGLSERRQLLLDAGARSAHLSGSGPALYSLEHSAEDAARVAGRLSAMDVPVLVTRTTSDALRANPPFSTEERACRAESSVP